jgi:ABC-type branched-subunit amino acid transport system substrate-binding protein
LRIVITAAVLVGSPGAVLAGAEATAASRPPVSIAMFISSRSEECYDRGDVIAIKRLATQEQDRINRQGGIAGRRVQLRFLDDRHEASRLIANVRTALAEPQLLAMVGVSSSNMAKAVFDAAGREIEESGAPFLSNISVSSIFAEYPNVFTMRASEDEERMPVLVQFVKQGGFRRPAFAGLKDIVFSAALGDGLKAALSPDGGLAADHRLRLEDNKLRPGEVAAMIADLKEKQPDLLFLTVGSSRSGAVLKQLIAAGVTPPLFITGRIESLPSEVTSVYPANIYQLAWDGLPDAYNDRMRKLMGTARPEDWTFAGSKVPDAPGWKTGECKPRAEEVPNPLEATNLRAIGIGAQYSDMVGLVAAAARTADPNADLAALRTHVLGKLRTSYATGKGIYQGSFENWSFGPVSRAAARTPFIVMLAQGLGRPQLAPQQFVRLRNDVLKPIETLYFDLDLIRAIRIDDNEKTFFAEFYLSMREGSGASIDWIEFSNGFLDPRTNDRQITVRTLHKGGKSSVYPDDMKVYLVSGKFTFEPRLESYPFDVQRFSIDVRPKLSEAPFVIQPPPESLRDTAVITDGWDPKDQYVGYDEDFVQTVDARTHGQSVVPFYKASFVWLMKRQTTDYYLRVVVPLAFILIIAYLSIFIPPVHFEAIVTIQVTALLSAVALYLALPKIDSDAATLSDRIFLFDYMAVSLMIGISIIRVSPAVASRRWLKGLLGFMHIVIVPALVGAMAFYVYTASQAG